MGLKPGSKQWYRPTAETQMIVPLVAVNESNLKIPLNTYCPKCTCLCLSLDDTMRKVLFCSDACVFSSLSLKS